MIKNGVFTPVVDSVSGKPLKAQISREDAIEILTNNQESEKLLDIYTNFYESFKKEEILKEFNETFNILISK